MCCIYKQKCWSFRHFENFASYGSDNVRVINGTSRCSCDNKSVMSGWTRDYRRPAQKMFLCHSFL
jgi:hypothetical protein